MKTLDQFTKDNFKLEYMYIGRVVNIQDPELRDRVQVRILGLISDDVLDENCPWAEQLTSIFSGTPTTTGVSSVPNIGSLVYIQFLYGDISRPIYTGYVRGASDSSNLHHLKDLTQTIHQKRIDNMIGPELTSLNDKTKYPYNNVIETKSGNIIELDDTEGNERIAIEHNTGSYMEIRPDGKVILKSIDDLHLIVKKSVEEYIESNYNGVIKGKRTINIDGSDTQTVDSYSQSTTNGRTINTQTTTHIGDYIITGDVIVSGNVIASDCISSGISGKSHTHPGDSGGVTGEPQ